MFKQNFSAVLLIGPTACGKTALALALAQRLPVEIVSVDSALVYRGMDIGTAKPSLAERTQVPHHLIDICDATQTYSAAQFVRDAERCIQDIQARGKLPLLVGGTMLYFKALTEGLNHLPSANAELRAQLDAQAAQHGWPALHARLAQLDPQTAQRLALNDAQRIQRALEVIELTGQPLSALQAEPNETSSLNFLRIALQPTDRALLHQRIAQRFDAMLEVGFLEEVKALQKRGDLHAELPSMRAVGYRQAWDYLTSQTENNTAISFAEFRERGIAATRQLAKRQLTWLRSMPVDLRLDFAPTEQLEEKVLSVLEKPSC